MSKQDFTSSKVSIDALKAEDVSRPITPVSIAVQEAEDLAVWAKADIAVLIKAGLNPVYFETLPTRAGALRYIQSEWMSDKNSRTDGIKKWQERAPIGFDLKVILLHNFRFAFFGNDDLLKRVDEIAQDSGNADMIQDLMDCSTLGTDNLPKLQAIGFDTKLLKQAADLSNELGELLAYNNNDQGQSNELKEQRDRAFTYLMEAVKEIRRAGQFAFWRNEERKKGYSSDYRR